MRLFARYHADPNSYASCLDWKTGWDFLVFISFKLNVHSYDSIKNSLFRYSAFVIFDRNILILDLYCIPWIFEKKLPVDTDITRKVTALTETFSLLKSCKNLSAYKWNESSRNSWLSIYVYSFAEFLLVVILYKPKFCPNTTINFLNPINNNISLYFDYILKQKGAYSNWILLNIHLWQ